MKTLNFIRSWSEIYFSEKEKVLNTSRIWWFLILIFFLGSYILQIYGFVNFSNDSLSNYWAVIRSHAVIFQSIVLFGIFVKFLSLQFRGRFALRFSELGEFIAFAACLKHYLLTIETYSTAFGGTACFTPPLIGVPHFAGGLILIFFMGWLFYKFNWVIAVTWKTVRK